MTQEEWDVIRNQINYQISVLEKSINTLSELIDGEVQSDVNDWFTSNKPEILPPPVIPNISRFQKNHQNPD